MDARELRIGNYIQIDNRICEVESVDREYIEIKGAQGFDVITLHHFEPIPLTEEWLIRMGFEKNDIWFRNQNVVIAFDNGKFWFMNIKEPIAGIEIKYVHKLQNLYFDFKSEELEIK